jgi:hypothetical protein
LTACRVKVRARVCGADSCKKKLVRRPGETTFNFKRRSHCNRSCACVVGHRWRGQKRPKVTVPCSRGCGTMIERAVHVADAACGTCKHKGHRERENAANRKIKDEVRRYRILMATIGFESFEETMAYLRAQPWTVRAGKRFRDLSGDARAAA